MAKRATATRHWTDTASDGLQSSSLLGAIRGAPRQHVGQERHGELKQGEHTLLRVLRPGQADDAQAQEGQVWPKAADGPDR
jgi:hypothetical protein